MAALTVCVRCIHENYLSMLNHVYKHHFHHGVSSHCVSMISPLNWNIQSRGREWKKEVRHRTGMRHRTELEGFMLRKV